jgi:hypothetical protein
VVPARAARAVRLRLATSWAFRPVDPRAGAAHQPGLAVRPVAAWRGYTLAPFWARAAGGILWQPLARSAAEDSRMARSVGSVRLFDSVEFERGQLASCSVAVQTGHQASSPLQARKRPMELNSEHPYP